MENESSQTGLRNRKRVDAIFRGQSNIASPVRETSNRQHDTHGTDPIGFRAGTDEILIAATETDDDGAGDAAAVLLDFGLSDFSDEACDQYSEWEAS